MPEPEFVARHLADLLTSGKWEASQLADRSAVLLGRRARWISSLAKRLVEEFPGNSPPSQDEVEQFLLLDRRFVHACREESLKVCLSFEDHRPAMVPVAGRPETWTVPEVVTASELAEFLGITITCVYWLADLHLRQRKMPPERLRHYVYRWQAKRVNGSARLIEMPRWQLKTVQRRILADILAQIPVHWRAHGFCRGRSIKSFVEPHVGRAIVVRIDLKDFFPSIRLSRVRNIFRTAGYPNEVALLLAALCTNSAPEDVWIDFPQYGDVHDRLRHEGMLCRPHLPQGAPSSPALANLAAYRLDCRLHGLARSWAARYTRYADDLLFSGGSSLQRSRRDFLATVSAIVQEEGFRINLRKTRIMGRSMCQSAAGLTINSHVNVGRRQYDRLKAILHNCATLGPADQNREQLAHFRTHLNGRVAFVELVSPARGKRLRQLYERIDWS